MSAKPFSLLLLLWVAAQATAATSDQTAVTSHIPRESVASKGIASVGYSKRRHILEIEFVNGAVYRYLQVAPSVHRELRSADSKARYFVNHIKGNYPSVRVRPRTKDQTD